MKNFFLCLCCSWWYRVISVVQEPPSLSAVFVFCRLSLLKRTFQGDKIHSWIGKGGAMPCYLNKSQKQEEKAEFKSLIVYNKIEVWGLLLPER